MRRPSWQLFPAAARAAGVGAVAGLAGGVAVGGLMAQQGMTGLGPMAVEPTGVGPVVFVLFATATGAAFGAVLGSHLPGLATSVSGGLVFGLLAWVFWSLTLVPLLSGEGPSWSVGAAARTFPFLVGYLLHGALTGAQIELFARRPEHTRPEDNPAAPVSAGSPPARVVIVGGGFAGTSTARRLEQLAAAGLPVEVTLVSQSNYLLFTPMLAEVASSALEARHVSTPVRATCPGTRFVRGTATSLDTDRRLVGVVPAAGLPAQTMPYDHLVLALGAVPNFLGLPGIEKHGFTLKTLEDAIRLRNHVLSALERAEVVDDPAERSRQLTFVVAGAGFAGTEMIAELFDLVYGVLRYYPGIGASVPRFVLVHSGRRILPEISEKLAAYALEKLLSRGIESRLGRRVEGATSSEVRLSDGEVLEARTLVWTAGNRPHPLLGDVPAERSRSGALVVDGCLRVTGQDGVWALGDCAQIPDPQGAPYPPTAQHALREGTAVANNIAATLRGEEPHPFHFRAIGTLVALGRRTAVAEIQSRRFSGLFAWALWRGIYLGKLPGLEKKLRVLLDWTIELAFPRDIVVTADPPALTEPAPVPDMVTERTS